MAIICNLDMPYLSIFSKTFKMSEKFSLTWKDYHSNWTKSLSKLRKDTEFADVTLISDDMEKFSAHKIILSSCSNTFKFILKENSNATPLLFLGGVSSANLEFILDYIYYGEVSLHQEQLDSFLESAQKLEIEGLMGMIQEYADKNQDIDIKQEEQDSYYTTEAKPIVQKDNKLELKTQRRYSRPSSTSSDVARIDVTSLNAEEVEQKIKELYEKVDGVWACMTCDYTSTKRFNVRKHVDKHIDGLSYSCNLCDKEFRSSNSFYAHKSTAHVIKQ